MNKNWLIACVTLVIISTIVATCEVNKPISKATSILCLEAGGSWDSAAHVCRPR